MEDASHFAQALRSATAFASLTASQFEQLYRFCSLKVLAKGEAATVAGSPVDELHIVLAGCLTTAEGTEPAQDFGRGQALEETAFFTHGEARFTLVARRESVLLSLAWDDLLAATRVDPGILASSLTVKWDKHSAPPLNPAKPSRFVLCPAGAANKVDSHVVAALLQAFEAMGDMRLLTRTSFGAGLPGAITMDEPQAVHWLQEQETAFDLTVIVADPAEVDFSNEAIEAADEVILVAGGHDPSLGAFEKHAFDAARERCRLLLPKGQGFPGKDSASWIAPRPCRAVHRVDVTSAEAINRFCSTILGRGIAVAAASRGVYAAAIAGALQALEASGIRPGCLGAAGSAILPAGLLASGMGKSEMASIFGALSSPHLWRRAARAEAGLFEATPLDRYLVDNLSDLQIEACHVPFVAVSRSLSAAGPELHRTGRLRGAIRANLAPPGILPPLVIENGAILASGEGETAALLGAVQALTPSPIIYLHAKGPSLGTSSMSYRDLAQTGLFRLTPFHLASPVDWRLRLETVLATLGEVSPPPTGEKYSFEIPIPESVMPLDWDEWAALQDAAYEWTLAELRRKGWVAGN